MARQWTPEQKKAFGEKMRKAREAKKAVRAEHYQTPEEILDELRAILKVPEGEKIVDWAKKVWEKVPTETPKISVATPNVQEVVQQPTHPLADIVHKFFPEIAVNVKDLGTGYQITFSLQDGQRSFVVNRMTSIPETESWCKTIKNKVEGKDKPTVTGTNLMMGRRERAMQQPQKRIPPEIGADSEFFFRE